MIEQCTCAIGPDCWAHSDWEVDGMDIFSVLLGQEEQLRRKGWSHLAKETRQIINRVLKRRKNAGKVS